MEPRDREILWSDWLNKLVFCYGCGKFGLPRGAPPVPRGWKVLYQPHPDGPPGLHVCSDGCADRVRKAMARGPVLEPLEIASDFGMMPADVRESWERHVRESSAEMVGERMGSAMRPLGEWDREGHRRVTEMLRHGIPDDSQKEVVVEEEPVRLVPRGHPVDRPLAEVPSRQRLGEAMRRARCGAGKLSADSAQIIGWNPCDLEEAEAGERQLNAEQIRELLVYYGQSDRTSEFVVYAREWYQDLYHGDQGVVADGPPGITMAGRTVGGRSPAELADLVSNYEAVLIEARSSLVDFIDEARAILARIDEVLPAPEPVPDDVVDGGE